MARRAAPVALAIANAFERAGYPASLAQLGGVDVVLIGDQTTDLPPIVGDLDALPSSIPFEHRGVWCRVLVEPERGAVMIDVLYRTRSDMQRVLAETLPESVTRTVQSMRAKDGVASTRGIRTSGQMLANLSFVLEAVERKREPSASGDLIPLVAKLGKHFGQTGLMAPGQLN